MAASRRATVRVTQGAAVGMTKRDVAAHHRCRVVFGRILRKGELMLYKGGTGLELGDVLTVGGDPVNLAPVIALLGEEVETPIEQLEGHTGAFEDKRVFVSNPAVVGRPLKELQLPSDFDAMVTRLRRGDLWFVPNGETRLELGDRVRLTARRERMDELVELFGDSYRDLSEADFLTFAVGLAAGLALGMVPIPLPGGIHFRLGFAGGPLVMALILGKVTRVGRFVWSFPYGASLTIRQLGLLLFSQTPLLLPYSAWSEKQSCHLHP
jgi:putative transport protein